MRVRLVRGTWKLLVAVKDGLVLLAMLLFFGALFAALVAKPNPSIKPGALLVALDGTVVEQPSAVDPFAALSGTRVAREHRLRDVVHALDKARDDKRVKVVVLDLDRFVGGYPAVVAEVGAAVGRVRASGKPVLAYATAYTDSGYLVAANASEIWVNPMGGAMFSGPGGSQLYYKGLIDKLGINAHVYRVGEFKSAVEPFTRTDQSEAARAANQALYGSLFSQWREAVAKARPKAKIDDFVTQPDKLVLAAGGDIAKANLASGLVDQVGDRIAFGNRIAAIDGVGPADSKAAGSFKAISLKNWIAANPQPKSGAAIGVLTIAGEIVDGKSGSGTAGGDTISKLVLQGLAKKDLKALVVRVDSPGGSALASEQMRLAILQAKEKGLPVVVSMGGLAASGGYWVSTPGEVIFAEPNTITGSIGIFGLIPTFERTLAKIGVTTDGVQTTPLTGQPNIYAGTNAAFDTLVQATIENGYSRFIGLVAQSRRMTPERVNQIGQGRVWDGGTARQLGLVDRFGTLSDAVAEAARRAKLDPDKVHAAYLEKEPGAFEQFVDAMTSSDNDRVGSEPGDLVSRLAGERRALLAQAVGDARRLVKGNAAMQARCLECAGLGPAVPAAEDVRLLDLMLARVGL